MHPAGEKAAQLFGAGARAVAQHDDGERPLDPFRMRHGDHRRFLHGGVAHEGVLHRDRADPLAARLDQVLGAVGQVQVPLRVDGDHVAGLEPAVVRPAVLRALHVRVGRGDPRTPDLELALGLAIPRHLAAALVDAAHLYQPGGEALLGADAHLLVVGHLAHAGLEP